MPHTTSSEYQKQLEALKDRKDLSPDEKKKEQKRLRRRIRKSTKGTVAATPRARGRDAEREGLLPPPSAEVLSEYRERVENGLKKAGLKEINWDAVNQKFAEQPPYAYDLSRGFQLQAQPETYIQKFNSRWDEQKPEWFVWTRQGSVPILCLGPTPKGGKTLH